MSSPLTQPPDPTLYSDLELIPIFQELSDFLCCYIEPGEDRDDETDEGIARWCSRHCSPQSNRKTIEEGTIMLATIPFPQGYVSLATNKHFNHEASAKEWLSRMLAVVEQTLASQTGF